MSEPECRTCRFWELVENENGNCRKRAPYSFLVQDEQFLTPLASQRAVWPSTDALDWCGEWEQQWEQNPG